MTRAFPRSASVPATSPWRTRTRSGWRSTRSSARRTFWRAWPANGAADGSAVTRSVRGAGARGAGGHAHRRVSSRHGIHRRAGGASHAQRAGGDRGDEPDDRRCDHVVPRRDGRDRGDRVTALPPIVAIYADESCLGNGRDGNNPGGAAGVIEYVNARTGQLTRWDYWVSEPATTNNRMALRSFIEAMHVISRQGG